MKTPISFTDFNKTVISRVQMEVQFVGANPISLTDFNKTHFQLIGVNTTLSGKQNKVKVFFQTLKLKRPNACIEV